MPARWFDLTRIDAISLAVRNDERLVIVPDALSSCRRRCSLCVGGPSGPEALDGLPLGRPLPFGAGHLGLERGRYLLPELRAIGWGGIINQALGQLN